MCWCWEGMCWCGMCDGVVLCVHVHWWLVVCMCVGVWVHVRLYGESVHVDVWSSGEGRVYPCVMVWEGVSMCDGMGGCVHV